MTAERNSGHRTRPHQQKLVARVARPGCTSCSAGLQIMLRHVYIGRARLAMVPVAVVAALVRKQLILV